MTEYTPVAGVATSHFREVSVHGHLASSWAIPSICSAVRFRPAATDLRNEAQLLAWPLWACKRFDVWGRRFVASLKVRGPHNFGKQPNRNLPASHYKATAGFQEEDEGMGNCRCLFTEITEP